LIVDATVKAPTSPVTAFLTPSTALAVALDAALT
jgi:hypothetical protein